MPRKPTDNTSYAEFMRFVTTLAASNQYKKHDPPTPIAPSTSASVKLVEDNENSIEKSAGSERSRIAWEMKASSRGRDAGSGPWQKHRR